MRKPNIGEKVRILGEAAEIMPVGKVFEVHDRIDTWWDTAMGENKVALLDFLETLTPEQAKQAEWYAQVESVECRGETMAVASFEVEFIDAS